MQIKTARRTVLLLGMVSVLLVVARRLHVPRRLLGRLFGLPPAETYDVVVERDIPVPMPDGVTLLGDHYIPQLGAKLPTVLVRSPYGRRGVFGSLAARPFAEHGFQVFIQSCRGTFGSGGDFHAFTHEREDGLATIRWLKQQSWFSGELATTGPSYLGLTQWAVAAESGDVLKALSPQITASEFRSVTYAGGSFALDTTLAWIRLVAHQEKPLSLRLLAQMRTTATLGRAAMHLPLIDADVVAAGRPVRFYREWLEHDPPDDDGHQPVDFSRTVGQVTAPVHLIAGWYDIFLPAQLADYDRLRDAGRQPYLTIGPWAHISPRGLFVMLRESILWFRAHLVGQRDWLRTAPVRVFVMGTNEWRDLPAWPPDGYAAQRWHLQPGAALAPAPPVESAPDRYRYDPADPTPAVGGASLSLNSGPKDNRALEARPDVLVYSSHALPSSLEVCGPVRVELWVSSTLEYTDFFGRLCDVDPSGTSVNICDGLMRLAPGKPAPQADGCKRISVELWPTAYCFRPGHRIRLQVSSGAHPRYVRNLGSGEPLATGTTLVAADQVVYHDPEHPSALILPVRVDG